MVESLTYIRMMGLYNICNQSNQLLLASAKDILYLSWEKNSYRVKDTLNQDLYTDGRIYEAIGYGDAMLEIAILKDLRMNVFIFGSTTVLWLG